MTQTQKKPDAPVEPKPWIDVEGNLICDCQLMAVNPLTKDDEMGYRWELHELLRGVEQMTAMDALELMADVTCCEIWPMESGGIAVFAGQHQWVDQTSVFKVFHHLAEIAEGFELGMRSRRT
jgi:hypothetical protein